RPGCRRIFMAYGALRSVTDHFAKPITNKAVFFPRDYVYKQFHTEKPNFNGPFNNYYDVSKDEFGHGVVGNRYLDFDESSDNYEFTGGDFPQLLEKDG